MNWRYFFKPHWSKILFFILTMGGLNYWIISTTHSLDARVLVGLPLGFYPIGSFKEWYEGMKIPTVEFSWLNFILNIVFWYLFACLIFYSIDYVIRKIKEGKTGDTTQ